MTLEWNYSIPSFVVPEPKTPLANEAARRRRMRREKGNGCIVYNIDDGKDTNCGDGSGG
jgi:hypothetical protein